MKFVTLEADELKFIESLRGKTEFTEKQWEEFLNIVRSHGIPAYMYPEQGGFAIHIYNHPQRYKDPLPILVTMCQDQIPYSPKAGLKTVVDCAEWVGRQLTHTAQNNEILFFYRLIDKITPPHKCCLLPSHELVLQKI